MHDPLTSPATALLRRGQDPTRRPCNIVSYAASAFSSHSPLACPEPLRGVTRHFDRYTCRTKNAVSPAPSTKVPNLIDTDFGPRPVRCNIVLRADPTRIGILLALTKEGSGASRSEGSLRTFSHPLRIRIVPALRAVAGRANIMSQRISPAVSRCNIRYMAQRLRLATVQISRHPCREISRVTPIPSTKPPKYLGTLLCASRKGNPIGQHNHNSEAWR